MPVSVKTFPIIPEINVLCHPLAKLSRIMYTPWALLCGEFETFLTKNKTKGW